MSNEKSQQQFSEAKKLYAGGRYEEALTRLAALSELHPGVFNIQFPMLQCLQRLGRVAEARSLHDQIRGMYTEESQQAKLRNIEGWIVTEENKAGAGDGLPVVQFDILDDIFEKPKPKKTVPPPKKSALLPFALQKKHIIAAAVVFALLAGGYFGYNAVIRFIFAPPEFTADMALKLPYDTFNGKIHFRNTKLLRTEIMGKIFLTKGGQSYALFPDSQKYAVLRQSNSGPSLFDGFKDMKLSNLKKAGRETLHGYDCTVYEVTADGKAGGPKLTSRVWYAKEIRLPIQIENSMPPPMGKIVISLQNIKIGPVNDSLFEIPGNYAISHDSPTMMELIMDIPSPAAPAAPLAIPSPALPPPGNGVPDNAQKMSNPDVQNILKQLKQQQGERGAAAY